MPHKREQGKERRMGGSKVRREDGREQGKERDC